MLPSFPYIAMTITGAFHLIFGISVFISNMCGFKRLSDISVDLLSHFQLNANQFGLDSKLVNSAYRQILHVYLGVVTGAALWMIVVGILGILAGQKSFEHHRTNSLKIAYMVTAILSAVIFAPSGMSLSVVINFDLAPIGIVGGIFSFAEFVLAIVSSSICCCCANTATPTGGVVFQHTTVPPNVVNVQTYPQGYPPQVYPPQGYPPQGYTQTYPPPANDQGFTNPGYGINGPVNEKV